MKKKSCHCTKIRQVMLVVCEQNGLPFERPISGKERSRRKYIKGKTDREKSSLFLAMLELQGYMNNCLYNFFFTEKEKEN